MHIGLNVGYGNVEVFKLDGGGVMYGIMNTNIKGKKGSPTIILVGALHEGGEHIWCVWCEPLL